MPIKKDKTNYEIEYKNHLRCPGCNRKTTGKNNYKNELNGKLTKTCDKCRLSVRKAHKKKPRTVEYKVPEVANVVIKILKLVDETTINEILDKNPDFKPVLEYVNSSDRYSHL